MSRPHKARRGSRPRLHTDVQRPFREYKPILQPVFPRRLFRAQEVESGDQVCDHIPHLEEGERLSRAVGWAIREGDERFSIRMEYVLFSVNKGGRGGR